jgi:DNA polymerase-3 subunit alpha
MYIHCHSFYSFKYGVLPPHQLLDEAIARGVSHVALTDINSTSGSLYHIYEAQKKGINPIVGVDFRNKENQCFFIAIAQNNEGFMHINQFLTDVLAKKQSLEKKAPILPFTYIIYPLTQAPVQLAENEYIGIAPEEVVYFHRHLRHRYADRRCIALYTSDFRHQRDFNTHRLLRAIDNNILLSQLPPHQQGKQSHTFQTQQELQVQYQICPYLLQNTFRLLQSCKVQFYFDNKANHQNKKTFTGNVHQDFYLLKQLVEEGLQYRFKGKADATTLARVEKELQIIETCDFVPYFLINHDIINYAKHKNYFHVGRGSGANSLVAYLLGITNVNPVELDLYFERFINPSRKSPPDFDIDFSWTDRNDVTRYIFEKHQNAALMGAFVTFQRRSVIREIGKVLGLTDTEIKDLQSNKIPKADNQIAALCVRYSHLIHGLPDHLTVHSSGIVITEKPIAYYGAMSLPPKGFPTAHFDMHIAEDAGIYKYDILAQRGLGKIKDTLTIIQAQRPNEPPVDIHDIERFKSDPKVIEMLRQADTIGCFYVESPAMRSLIKKLEVDNYISLVAASSIIRPGVSSSGMMTEYIKRHRDPSRRKDAHPVLAKLLQETYGIMVYQEDVLRVAHYFAGLTLEEADVLRRAMSWKFRERAIFKEVRDLFFSNCKERGYADKLVEEIWTQIESFANYAFAKGHSASYAVESYQCLFLKAYYPLEFLVATVNNFGGFYTVEHYLQEARLNGAIIEPPCVNISKYETILLGNRIYLGFQHIKNLEFRDIKKLLQTRKQVGTFEDFDHFIEHTAISLQNLIILIRIDALRFTQKSKQELLWLAHFKMEKTKKFSHPTLFYTPSKTPTLPTLDPCIIHPAYDQLDLLGFPLCSPFRLISESYLKYNITSQNFKSYVHKRIYILGYLVNMKRVRTNSGKGKDMGFGTFTDRRGAFFESVHFPEVYAKHPFRERACYLICGKIVEEYGYFMIEVSHIEKIPYQEMVVGERL